MDEKLKAALTRARERLDRATAIVDGDVTSQGQGAPTGLAAVIAHVVVGAADLALAVIEDEMADVESTEGGA